MRQKGEETRGNVGRSSPLAFYAASGGGLVPPDYLFCCRGGAAFRRSSGARLLKNRLLPLANRGGIGFRREAYRLEEAGKS